MAIIIENYNELELFVIDNIVEINKSLKPFSAKKLKSAFPETFPGNEEPPYTETEIKPFLNKRFKEYIVINEAELDEKLQAISETTLSGIKGAIKVIANDLVLLESDIFSYYEQKILDNVKLTYLENKEYQNRIYQAIMSYREYSRREISETELKFIGKPLHKLLEDSLDIGLTNGFVRNMTNINTGTMTANEGDAAQFIFLARAILAGFTCANVDVRSCRYDAFIDYEGNLLRIQVKGITPPLNSKKVTIKLKDRDRGGSGNNPDSIRNKGKFISSKDCDIYVAVDKRFGQCYLVPAKDIDVWIAEGNTSMDLKDYPEYKENWGIVSQVAKELFGE